MIFYSLSGFIADVCCGRLKTIVVSLMFLLTCTVLMGLAQVILVAIPHNYKERYGRPFITEQVKTFLLILFVVGPVLLWKYQLHFTSSHCLAYTHSNITGSMDETSATVNICGKTL